MGYSNDIVSNVYVINGFVKLIQFADCHKKQFLTKKKIVEKCNNSYAEYGTLLIVSGWYITYNIIRENLYDKGGT